ncbi:hypothetical protein [Sphingomonas sp.]|uniref:ArnT family glycosyltransferase n=1 Tax=Sphingomonas sp. TaxID=28214 RepID=UPI0025DF5F4D|nr:hypothetical protein [Sphingomonas sp.]
MIPMPVFAALIVGGVSLNLLVFTYGYSSSLSNPDEGAHYINALFLGDWLRGGAPWLPACARDFREHFPTLSIGRWPPGWYLVEAPIFALFRPSPTMAAAISAFFAGLPGGVIFWAFARLDRRWFGLGLACTYALLPIPAEATRYILLDQPVALAVGVAAIAWARASEDPRPGRLLGFAAAAAFSGLVQGNGALILLVPAIDILLTRRWSLLRLPTFWLAMALAILPVAGWYALVASSRTLGIDPLSAFESLWSNLGPIGIALALWGGWRSFRVPGSGEARIAGLAVAVTIATLVFPADGLRPAAPMLPWLVILAGVGLLPFLRREAAPALVGVALAAAALVPAMRFAATLPPKGDNRAGDVGDVIAALGGIWMIDGPPAEEGASVAAAAYRDHRRRIVWVVLGSEWLGARTATDSPERVHALIERLGVKGTAAFAPGTRAAYPHDGLLNQGVALARFEMAPIRYERAPGVLTRTVRWTPVTPHPELIAAGPAALAPVQPPH